RAQDIRPRGIADKGSDFRDFVHAFHPGNMARVAANCHGRYFGGRRSVPREIGWAAMRSSALMRHEGNGVSMNFSPSIHKQEFSMPPPSKSLVLFTTCLAVFIAQLDTSVVNLALKHIGASLSATVSKLQWVIDAYNLVY